MAPNPVLESTARKAPRSGWLRSLRQLGPGLVFILGALGPRDLVTNSIAGASQGMHLLWVLVVALIVRLALLNSSARYVMVTGESLLAGCGRLGRWVVLMWFAISVLRRHASALVRLMLLGTAANLVAPLPGPHGVAIWGVISWSAGFVLLYWGRYKAVEKMSKPLVAIMGGCLLAAAILSRPDLGLSLREALHPMLPPATGHYSTAIVVMAMLA